MSPSTSDSGLREGRGSHRYLEERFLVGGKARVGLERRLAVTQYRLPVGDPQPEGFIPDLEGVEAVRGRVVGPVHPGLHRHRRPGCPRAQAGPIGIPQQLEAPESELLQDRHQALAAGSYPVGGDGRRGRKGDRLDDARFPEALQPGRKQVAADPFEFVEQVTETLGTACQLAQDQHGPALAQQVQ